MGDSLEAYPLHKLLPGDSDDFLVTFLRYFFMEMNANISVCWPWELLVILLSSFKPQSYLHSRLAFCINAVMKYSSRVRLF